MAIPYPTLVQILYDAMPAIVELSILAVAGLVSFQYARSRQSRGLLMISTGFLIKVAIDGAWDACFYGLLGGSIGIVSSADSQGSSVQNVGQTLSFYYLIETIISGVSIALMVFFILYGALREISQRPAQAVYATTLPTTPPTKTEPATNFVESTNQRDPKNL